MEYRFKLEKYHGRATRHTCPSCRHARCFTHYVDTWGQITFPEDVGKCDRLNNCGYHKTPKQYFSDNPKQKKAMMNKKQSPFTDECANPPVSYHPLSLMRSTMKKYAQNNLYVYLCDKIGAERTMELFRLYNVGTAKNNATVFWLMDISQRLRGGKIILFGDDGHRVKGAGHDVNWAHRMLHLSDFNMKSCYFGEHLLAGDNKTTVAMVESEKSAIVASAYITDCIWIATGGLANGFSPGQLALLKGRKVVLFPDLGGTEIWRGHLEKMNSMGIHASIFDDLEKAATEEERAKGLDIADYLLQADTGEAQLKRMVERNPAIQLLVDKLSLEIA